jgi:very-short-patch-repair endonuclease
MKLNEEAKMLRKNQTVAENKMWQAFRNRQLSGYKFLRQHILPLGEDSRFCIADFYCHEAKLAIEIDGGIHNEQKDYDEYRSELLMTKGIKVIRFSNQEVFDNLNNILDKIKTALVPPL